MAEGKNRTDANKRGKLGASAFASTDPRWKLLIQCPIHIY